MTNKHDNDCNCKNSFNSGHDCDCGHDHNHDLENKIIHLTLTDDTELECSILGNFHVEGQEYIALLPINDERVLLYRYDENEEGIDLSNIEDDEEFELVSQAFYELFGDEEEDDEE